VNRRLTSGAAPSAEALLAAFEAQGRRCAGPAYQTVWAARALAEQTVTLLALGDRLASNDEDAKRDHRRRKRLIEDVVAEARRDPS
jgi:hypothetical protein